MAATPNILASVEMAQQVAAVLGVGETSEWNYDSNWGLTVPCSQHRHVLFGKRIRSDHRPTPSFHQC